MQHVATLISPPDKHIGKGEVSRLTALLGEWGVNVTRQAWLSPDEACDIFFEGTLENVTTPLSQFALDAGLDVIAQKAEGRRKKALLADMESTIIKEEMLEELADFVGLRAKVEEITTRAMNGELDFKAALKERLALLGGLSADILEDLCKKMTINDGARELVATMRKHGARCVLVSGGFQVFTGRVASMLGFDENYGNVLDVQNGKISGQMVEPVLDKTSKLNTLNATAQKLNITAQQTVAVGDGANDLPMLLSSGLGIAYRAKPTVQKQANFNLRFANLRGLLWAQGYHVDEVVGQ